MTKEKVANRWERRFRRARNAALVVGSAAVMAFTEVPTHASFATSVVSLGAASNLELWRFFATPDSERKRRITRTLGKCASICSFYVAATFPIEAATLIAEATPLVANDTKPIPVGLVNMRNFVAQDETWLPDSTGESVAYAAGDVGFALLAAKQGLSAWRRKEDQRPAIGHSPEVTA